ncbi:rhomboid family intramembrane serine protease [Halobacillus litoralis]|uniref:Rhomboid family intramembrane serine protease n=1 Tax=Halobacillus litoralis TaxID=45668 RepID=A0A410MHM4_9BACI|nr:rhomboid family intramembrane serine protease [Halobacillus litoralis]QAS54190.1 rhomboid family intramembrane serine protease [Halobacillus litoralis]
MFIQQEFYLWKLTYDLVIGQDFQVLHMNTEEGEVWLEKGSKWKTHVVRLKHKQINWRSELKRDVEATYEQLKNNRQLFRGGKVHLHSLYISEHPPVDEWEDITEQLPDSKIPTRLYYLSDSNKDKEKSRFYDTVGLNEPLIDQHINEQEMEAMIPYIKQQVVSQDRTQKKRMQSLFEFGKPRITYVLLMLNILIFTYVEWKGDSTSVLTLIEFGAKYNPAIISGEWWRIATSMFLHIGTLHLLMNMFALFYLGTAVEKIYGTWRFFVIYMLAGIFGGVASFMLNPHVAAGASGAIFGLFGALLYFGVQHKRLFFRTMGWNLLFIIGLNIVFGLLVPQVDNGAHMGGLIGGFLASALINMPGQKNKKLQSSAFLLYLIILGAMVFMGATSIFNGEQTLSQVQETQELNQKEAYDIVIEKTTAALDDPGEYEAELLFNRSYAYYQTEEIDRARKDLHAVIDLAPDMAEAHYNLALLYQSEGELEKAGEHAATAVDLKPDQEDFQNLNKELQ